MMRISAWPARKAPAFLFARGTFPRPPATRIALWCLAIVLSACGGEITPEQEIRALVREAELAAEERQIGDLARLVSEAYADSRGNDRAAVVGMLRLEMLRNQVIYLMTRMGDIRVDGETATAVVYVAMAGGPLERIEDLARLGAELYRFDLSLAKESGKWRITGARWARALEQDFG